MKRSPLIRRTALVTRTRLTTTASIAPKPKPGPKVKTARAPLHGVEILKGDARYRVPGHLRFVATHRCLVCRATPVHVHHPTHAQPKARGLKAGDQWAVPLCPGHHHALHADGGERDWWARLGIDALAWAAAAWERSPARVAEPE